MIKAAGIIIAGGQARRMGGGDKALVRVEGRSLLERVIERLAPQVSALALNANGDPARFAPYPLPVLADDIADQPGPLAGIVAGMAWARTQNLDWVLGVAADTPLLPLDLARRLWDGLDDSTGIAVAASQGRVHPTCALWPCALEPEIRAALDRGQRAVWRFAESRGAVVVEWPVQGFDPFANVNTPADVAMISEILKRR